MKNSQSEINENEFQIESNSINLPPSRTPLNTIADPSQCQAELDHSSRGRSEKKTDSLDHHHTLSKRTSRGKAQSEPNSAQSTPARSVSRTSNISGLGAFTGPRPPQFAGGKGGSSSRVPRGIFIENSELQVEIPQFELVEDPSFWNDHNVQVLIRIRPVSSMEKVSQGYGQCLKQESAQTLVWLGHPEVRFTFDHIACEAISQEKLFKVAGLPMVDNCMSGYNSCMFAYGQTGSGKTYTMMGEIGEMDGKLDEDCGITPRVFEYLFTRIKEEEEKRRNERLKYTCKCSFLEIYNEQITDLLEPSSTNLQLREDLKKGVYVENLMEHSVTTVTDVLRLLLQGAANRKMAATHMNSESSRSHSVFTCIIESRWEKDSMAHLRFGRLNLVDLAGSERQKSSGAEGDRLKEAANINKSLSTLSLVIMSLVDLAHGKHRHVPYRDSRLTFLLQDSLGGNSKTTIIANVSPSICSANETLSTLKFAQRAKLIQNNAKVNEDASGDVTALQRQVQQLKGQLSFLMKHRNPSKPLSHCGPLSQWSSLDDFPKSDDSFLERKMYDDHDIPNGLKRKMKCLEATLVGALRREKLAENSARRLDAEIEHMNRLAQQREEDGQRAKMMLRFREEKIKRLELLADGLVSADKYLMDENNTLIEEIKLLRARIDRNPELTRFALENIRLIEQLRLLQDFHEQGEKEILVAEISALRDQLLETLEVEERYGHHNFLSRENKDDNAVKELEECKNMNSKLISMFVQVGSCLREVDKLRNELGQYMSSNQAACYSVENSSHKNDVEDETVSSDQLAAVVQQNQNDQKMGDASVLQSSDTLKELMEARILMEAMESEQVCLIEELQQVRQENHRLIDILSNEDKVERIAMLKLDKSCNEQRGLENQNLTLATDSSKDISIIDLQIKLDTMTKDLEEARLLGYQYLEDRASQLSRENQTDLIREEVELETTRTILHLQEEVAALQSEFQKKLCSVTEENKRLRNIVASKDDEIRALHAEWESASLELTRFLLDGSKSLRDASGQIKSIACSFPRGNFWVGEHVEKAAKSTVEKEETILLLQKNLEDAHSMVLQMEQKLSTLRGATMALTEIQGLENDANSKEASQLTMMLGDKINLTEFHRPSELVIREAEAGCCNMTELIVDEEVCQASNFFTRFEEAHATVKEADYMLNALVKANDNSKQLTVMWKKAGEDLMLEKASLIEEIEQLKSSTRITDGESGILQGQIQYSLIEMSNSISVLEVAFLQMQRDVEEMCKAVYSEALTMAKDILHYTCFSRSSVEDICAEIMEKEFSSFVLHQCYVKYFSKLRNLNGLCPSILQGGFVNHLEKRLVGESESRVNVVKGKLEVDQTATVSRLGVTEFGPSRDDATIGSLELKKELERKEILLKGLLFDFSLLQESASTTKDIKDEAEKLTVALSRVQHELKMKTGQLDELLVQHRTLESCLADTETALFGSNSDLEQARETIDILSEQNDEMRILLKDLYLKKSETEEQLEEQREVVKSLEKEILRTNSSAEKQIFSSIKDIEDDLRRVTSERDQLCEQVNSLQDRLDMAYAVADENEAIAVEARQESEASKMYAEQKEEEVKILECSVEELEGTINALEKKVGHSTMVYEMEEEVERHRMIRDSLELEHQSLRHKFISTIENFPEDSDFGNSDSKQLAGPAEHQLSRKLHDKSLELHEARERMRVLEMERTEQAKEIKQLKEYVSELVLHADAQASQYQQKYKTLEAMVNEVQSDSSNLASTAPTLDKTERSLTRTRGSSSPFRCISSLVQQMNVEKDQELSIARLRVEELEALVASRQKEAILYLVCMLNTRLAAAESMTHDVIRDLLGVKLDMTNYADLIDQCQLQKLVEDAQQQAQDSIAMEQEILDLRRHIHDLIEEKERWISEINQREADILASQMTVEQLHERDQLLTAQNEMLKKDKTNLQRRVAELDDMLKKLFGTQQNTHLRTQQQINNSTRPGNPDLGKRLAQSERLLSRVNDELAQYHKSFGSNTHDRLDRRGSETKFRKQKSQIG
ncbi:hypothetical protein LguiB_025484 [Lonicera macranthoides]